MTKKEKEPIPAVQSCLHLAKGKDTSSSVAKYQPTAKKKKAVSQRKHRAEAKTSGIITADIKRLICECISQGKSLASVCRDNSITHSSVYSMLAQDSEFADSYARARERQADRYADEVVELADMCKQNPDSINKTRLQIDARKWACGKLHPRKYSDKAALEVTGKDGGAVMIAPAPVIEFVDSPGDDE